MKLTGRWFPQIVDRDSGIYIQYIYITRIVVLVSEPVRGDLGRPSCLVLLYSHLFILFT